MRNNNYILAVCLTINSGITLSQTPFWQPSGGPEGTKILSLSSTPSLIIGSTTWGMLFGTTNEGTTWSCLNRGYWFRFITSVDVNNAGVIVAAGYTMSSQRSTSGGTTWEPVASGLNGQYVYCVIADTGGIFLAGTMNSGLFRSIDHGVHWNASGLAGTTAYAIAKATTGALVVATSSGVYRSTNHGTLWQPSSSGLNSPYPERIVSSATGTLFALHCDGLGSAFYRSDNEGQSWSSVNSPITRGLMSGLSINPAGILFASFDNAEGGVGGVWRSTNSGLSWTKVFHQSVDAMCVSPTGNVILGDDSGITISTDDGTIWHPCNGGLTGDLVYAAEAGRIGTLTASGWSGQFHSFDSGASWSSLPPLGTGRLRHPITFASGNTLLMGYQPGGVVRSSDSGITWAQTNLVSGTADALVTLPGNVVLASLSPGGIFRSSDGGVTFANVSNQISPQFFAALPNSAFVLAGNGSSLFRSTNAGVSWNSLPAAANTIYEIASVTDSVQVAATSSGAFRSTNKGVSWSFTGPGSPQGPPMSCVLATDDGHLYLGATRYEMGPGLPGDGVFRSTDSGVTWSSVNDGLYNTTIHDLCLDSAGYLYAATEGNSMFKSTRPVLQPVPRRTGVSQISTGSATISGSITPRGLVATWFVEYGQSTSYGLTTTPQLTGNGSTPEQVFVSITGLQDGTRYHYRFAASNLNGTRRDADGNFMTMCLSPELVSPNDSAAVTTSVRFTWRSRRGSASYRLLLSTDSSFIHTTTDTTTIDTLYVSEALQQQQQYYWKVAAQNESGLSAFSMVRTFRTILQPPSVPSLLVPLNGAQNQPLALTMQWERSILATDYSLQVTYDSSFQTGFAVNDTVLVDTVRVVDSLALGTLYFWRVRARNASGSSEWSSPFRFKTTTTTSVFREGNDIPTENSLSQNFPNPFNPTTRIRFQVAHLPDKQGLMGLVTLKVLDLLGREIATLVNERMDPGKYERAFDATGLASGVYLYRMQAGSFVQVKKLVVLR